MKYMISTTNNIRAKYPNLTLPSSETISNEKYDGPTPNPQGRLDLEIHVGNKAKLLRCKREIVVNVRTIRNIINN